MSDLRRVTAGAVIACAGYAAWLLSDWGGQSAIRTGGAVELLRRGRGSVTATVLGGRGICDLPGGRRPVPVLPDVHILARYSGATAARRRPRRRRALGCRMGDCAQFAVLRAGCGSVAAGGLTGLSGGGHRAHHDCR